MKLGNGLTPRGCMQLLLSGRNPGLIPFSIWSNKLPKGSIANELLAAGACIIAKSTVYETQLKSIKADVVEWVGEDQRRWRSCSYFTRSGVLEEKMIVDTGSLVRKDFMFKGPEDYDGILSLIGDYDYTPCFDRFIADDKRWGDQGIARPAPEKSPFFEIIYEIMGVLNFAVEWSENRNRVMDLYEALLKARKKRMEIVASSPASFVIVDGNIDMSMIGNKLFNEYYAPVISNSCELLHNSGKKAGLHLDGNNRHFLKPVWEIPVDLIESFTPPPDCDVSISEALEAWPGKLLMVNFPSSLHLDGAEAVKAYVRMMMKECNNYGRVVIGVSEDVPVDETLPVLARTVKESFGYNDGKGNYMHKRGE